MRLKLSYNFLRSGCSFYYWDIFSGLSNENLGTALYFCIASQVNKLNYPFNVKYISTSSILFSSRHQQCINNISLYNFSFAGCTKYIIMKTTKPKYINAIAFYQPLLERYAMRLTKDKAVAEKLTKDVLNTLYDVDTLLPSARLRKILQRDLRHRCFYWRQSQIFDRPVIKVPYKQEIQRPLLMNNNETTR